MTAWGAAARVVTIFLCWSGVMRPILGGTSYFRFIALPISLGAEIPSAVFLYLAGPAHAQTRHLPSAATRQLSSLITRLCL